jgi:uncharacterized protein YndB with AHSA1/START domain
MTEEPVIVFERVFDAPRELVFKASTEPKLFAEWWRPQGYTNEIHEMDVRPGGAWRIDQRGPDGTVYPFHGEYREVEAPARLVLTQGFADFPPALVTVTFEEQPDGRTKVTSALRLGSVEERDAMLQSGCREGAAQSLDRLAELLATLRSGQAG